MTRASTKSGFTLIELMLSMAFIAVLLIAIAGTTMEIMRIYTKGLTAREVNQSGRTLSEDIQRTLSSASAFKVFPANQPDSKYVTGDGGGRLCTGTYTYAWNYGKTDELSGGDSSLPRVFNRYRDSRALVRFVKVSDTGGLLCSSRTARIPDDRATELLAAGDRNLAIQEFIVTAGAVDEPSGQALYAISFTLGTNDRSQLTASGSACLPPSQGDGNEDFCAVDHFDIVVRASNRAGS